MHLSFKRLCINSCIWSVFFLLYFSVKCLFAIINFYVRMLIDKGYLSQLVMLIIFICFPQRFIYIYGFSVWMNFSLLLFLASEIVSWMKLQIIENAASVLDWSTPYILMRLSLNTTMFFLLLLVCSSVNLAKSRQHPVQDSIFSCLKRVFNSLNESEEYFAQAELFLLKFIIDHSGSSEVFPSKKGTGLCGSRENKWRTPII